MLIFNRIQTNRIISAFDNEIDLIKVYDYATTMQIFMLSHEFPPIQGFYSTISTDDVNNEDCYFMTNEKVGREHLFQKAFKVTNGHHRTLAAIVAHLPYLETQLDRNTLTTESELKEFDFCYPQQLEMQRKLIRMTL